MKQLSKSELNELNQKLKEQFGLENYFGKKDRVIIVETDKNKLIVRDKQADFFYCGDDVVPTLKLLLKQELLPKITIDMGAIKFVTSGADVMRPGITNIPDELSCESYVVIVDETHGKPLAVAKMKHNSSEMQQMEKGKVLKNLHWVADKIWNY